MEMYITDRDWAEGMLEWAGSLNPGLWIPHSRNVAIASEKIAEALYDKGFEIDTDIAYTCGLLHDIGRYKGRTPSIIHSLDGYRLLQNYGFVGNANTCITHSFSCEKLSAIPGWNEISEAIRTQINNCFVEIEWSLYDRIVLLCDALAEEGGLTTIERRIISAAIRNGVNSDSPLLWKGYYEAKAAIENMLGTSIYSILPGVSESLYREILLEN